MKYKLIGDNDIINIKETVLKNRGIEDIDKYLNLDSRCLNDYMMLDNVSEGVQLIKKAITNNQLIHIVVDCDPDGFTSAASMYDYIANKLGYKHIKYLLHSGKQHGLSKDIMCQIDLEDKGLVILPDAGTNDVEQCATLAENGFAILVLDHHEKELDNPHAIVINNQCCDYPNKSLCGMGIVYKFLQALDEEYWNDYAEEYIDLVALANVADVMDLRSHETKYLVDKGLSAITHPLLLAIIEKQSFSIKNTEAPTIIDISFYVTPLINAIIRMGTMEEKELLFKAFIKDDKETFEYTSRKTKNNPNPKTEVHTIYQWVARIGISCKGKQGRLNDKAVKEVVEFFDESNKKDSICFINATKLESVSKDITGLVAIKIASQYNKPCLILRKDLSKSTDGNVIFSGSARNINDGDIDDLKKELEKSGLFEMLAGHSNACGVSIKKENVQQAINYFNENYQTSSSKCYKVDFIFDESIDYKAIKSMYDMNRLYSGFVKQPFVAIENLDIDMKSFEINESKNGNRYWSFVVNNVKYLKFSVDVNDKMCNIDDFTFNNVVINLVGKTDINHYGSTVTPQVIIEDYEVIDKY